MEKREFKDKVYGELAKVAKAMANPVRLEIIDLLAQGPFTVEQIASYIHQSMANTSQHLQNLKNAKLVQSSKQGNFIQYALSHTQVYQTWLALRALGMEFNAEVDKVIDDFRNEQSQNLHAIHANELQVLMAKDEVIVLDVRSEEEYNRGHIQQAVSMPLDQLKTVMNTLDKGKLIVAYCRGPFCVYADEAVAHLLEHGFKAVRLEEGYPEWRLNEESIN